MIVEEIFSLFRIIHQIILTLPILILMITGIVMIWI
jgi:hypothetical protein